MRAAARHGPRPRPERSCAPRPGTAPIGVRSGRRLRHAPGEIAALQWDDVDFTTGRVSVRASLVRVGGRLVRGPVTTTAGIRVLPLVPLTRSTLLSQRGKQGEQRAVAGPDWLDTGYVFTTRSGRPVEPRNLSRTFDRIVAAAGLPRIVFHDLRRTAATLLKDLGVPARDAQTILGHANIAVTLGIYSEVPGCCQTCSQTPPPKIRRGRLGWWAILGSNQ